MPLTFKQKFIVFKLVELN